MVNHSIHFKEHSTGVHTNTNEGNWRSVKSSFLNRCRSKALASLYLVRYIISRNEPGCIAINVLEFSSIK